MIKNVYFYHVNFSVCVYCLIVIIIIIIIIIIKFEVPLWRWKEPATGPILCDTNNEPTIIPIVKPTRCTSVSNLFIKFIYQCIKFIYCLLAR